MNANNTLHDYLTAHFQDTIESHDSAVGILFDHYAESNGADTPKIHDALVRLRKQLASADLDSDSIMNTVFELCTLHEECGFLGGLNMGFTLAKELSSME